MYVKLYNKRFYCDINYTYKKKIENTPKTFFKSFTLQKHKKYKQQ